MHITSITSILLPLTLILPAALGFDLHRRRRLAYGGVGPGVGHGIAGMHSVAAFENIGGSCSTTAKDLASDVVEVPAEPSAVINLCALGSRNQVTPDRVCYPRGVPQEDGKGCKCVTGRFCCYKGTSLLLPEKGGQSAVDYFDKIGANCDGSVSFEPGWS